MATYEVTGPKGEVYHIDGPDGADPSAVIKQVTGITPQSSTTPNVSAAPPAAGLSLDDFLRKVALGGRSVGEGVVDTLAMPHDAMVLMQNAMRSGTNRVLGTNLQPVPTFAQGFSQALTDAGAPVPETRGEQYGTAITRGVASGLTGAGILGAVTPAATTAPNLVRTGVAGATSAGSSELARQSGASPFWQFAAGVAGGLSPSAIEGTARLGTRLAANLGRPLTVSGQEQIAANVLGRQATDRQAAVANLNAATDVVPGSPRTTGEVSQDIGLLALQKAIQGRNPAAFGQRISEQNVARQAELASLGGTRADIAAAQAARDATTAPMRESALSSPAAQAPTDSVHGVIDQILQSPAGARDTVSRTMQWAKELIGDETDPARLYEIRKDLQLAQMGKLQPASANAPNASTLAQARDSSDRWSIRWTTQSRRPRRASKHICGRSKIFRGRSTR